MPKFGDASTAIVGRIILLLLSHSWLNKDDHTLVPALHAEAQWDFELGFDWPTATHRRKWQCLYPAGVLRRGNHRYARSGFPGSGIRARALRLGAELRIAVDDLYAAYKNWAEDSGHSKKSKQTSGRDLRAAIPSISMERPRDGENRRREYVGIDIRIRDTSGV